MRLSAGRGSDKSVTPRATITWTICCRTLYRRIDDLVGCKTHKSSEAFDESIGSAAWNWAIADVEPRVARKPARHLTPSITMNRYAKADKAAIAPFVELPADARKPAPNVRRREVL